MASKECVMNVLDLFVRSKPGARLHDADNVVVAWCLILEPIPDGVVMEAAVMLARDQGDFLPSAGSVFQTALGLLDTEPSAEEAWEHVLQYSKTASRPPEDNPVKLTERESRSLELIGGNCGQWLIKDHPFRRKEFIEAYGGLAKRWRDGVALGQLPAGDDRKRLTAPGGER